MGGPNPIRTERRARTRDATRLSILDAARRVAGRDGARNLSLRGVASEAGFAPAALYGYFANKDELLLALAADDLSALSRAMRDAVAAGGGEGKLAAASAAALSLLRGNETFAAAQGALPTTAGSSEAERLFNGRMIAVLKVLSDATGQPANNRDNQRDVVLVAAALSGLALLSRSGRLGALGFTPEELLVRLNGHFAS
jgi:AcrR family transcriptional regulator